MKLVVLFKTKDGQAIRAVETTTDLGYVAASTDLRQGEIIAMLEERGRIDAEDCICIPFSVE